MDEQTQIADHPFMYGCFPVPKIEQCGRCGKNKAAHQPDDAPPPPAVSGERLTRGSRDER